LAIRARAEGMTMTNKYHARKTTIDGITFDSKAEATRYAELKLLERAGEISSLVLQPEFELIPAYTKNGRKIRAVKYRADFMYTDRNGNTVIEDVKGVRTKEFALKKKIFEWKYQNLTITEVKR